MSARQQIGDLIRERRLARGISLGQLATRLELTPANVRAWERGETTPGGEHVLPLVEALDLDATALTNLLAGSDNPEEMDDGAVSVHGIELDPAQGDDVQLAESLASASDSLSTADKDQIMNGFTESIPIPVVASPPPEATVGRRGATRPSAADRPTISPRGFAAPIKVPPMGFSNPLRLLFDPHRRFLYWVRYALTIVVLYILLRLLLWAGSEAWKALGELLETFRATDGGEEEALQFLWPV